MYDRASARRESEAVSSCCVEVCLIRYERWAISDWRLESCCSMDGVAEDDVEVVEESMMLFCLLVE